MTPAALSSLTSAARVDTVGVHTLRHSAAEGWLEAGVHIKAVADLLGHSSVAVTGDVYGHTSDDTARAAVDGRMVCEPRSLSALLSIPPTGTVFTLAAAAKYRSDLRESRSG